MPENIEKIEELYDEALKLSALGELSLNNENWAEAIKNYTDAITNLENAYSILNQTDLRKSLFSKYEKLFRKKVESYSKQMDTAKIKREKEEKANSLNLLEKQEQDKKELMEKETIEKLKKLIQVSKRISLDLMKDILNLDQKEFGEKILDWAIQFNFEIDSDYLNINKETMDDFIEMLDSQFKVWEQKEQLGIGKK